MMRFRLPTAAAVAAAAVAAAVAVAAVLPSPAAATTPTRRAPQEKHYTAPNGAACITARWVSGYKDGKPVWADQSSCCPHPMPTPKTMTFWRNDRRCTDRWWVAGRELNGDRNCVWRWKDAHTCEEPMCPPMPMEMKTRWVNRKGERCTKTWKACGKTISWGKCTWKGCDIIKCLPPCVKPMAKTMRTKTPTRVCVDNWWPSTLTVDKSDDLMHCKWKWADIKICWCKDGNNKAWKKC